MLFRIDDDPDHPFSEIVGLLQRVVREPDDVVYGVLRKNGELVEVAASKVITAKLVPTR